MTFLRGLKRPITLVWLRKELRIGDNAALYEALKQHDNVLLLYIFDEEELQKKDNPKDARINFVYQALEQMEKELNAKERGLFVTYGDTLNIFELFAKGGKLKAVYLNQDYTPHSIAQEDALASLLEKYGIPLHRCKDRVIFDQNEVLKKEGTPYRVYTPYMRAWKALYQPVFAKAFPSTNYLNKLYPGPLHCWPTLENMGFSPTSQSFPSIDIVPGILKHYEEKRDQLALQATSSLGVHLHFGTLSIRKATRQAYLHSDTWLNQLIWRNFFIMILAHFPHVVDKSFRPAYDNIPWRYDEEGFQAWCAGKTGFPLVDAGMRQLNATGLMHNRVRMVTASFLTKCLLIDWRWGEAYFAEKLLDYDLALNNGNWQWVAGCGCDAAPYFRIFSPMRQAERFDPDYLYIKKWVPEYGSAGYPQPIVDYKIARKRALDTYKKALDGYCF